MWLYPLVATTRSIKSRVLSDMGASDRSVGWHFMTSANAEYHLAFMLAVSRTINVIFLVARA